MIMNLSDPNQNSEGQDFESNGLDPVFDETLDAMNSGGNNGRGSRTRRLRTGALLLSGAIVLACGSLFFLGKSVRNAAATTVNPVFEQVDTFITTLTGGTEMPVNILAAAAETDRAILEVLSEPYTARQVLLQDVQRNPFILLTASVSMPDPKDDLNAIGRHSEARWLADQKTRRSDILKAAEELTVKSIIMGAVALANINGSIVRINDSIMTDAGIEFRIKAIGNTAVTAAARAPELDLEVEVVIPLKRK
jgi:hypothetical protein